MSTREISVTLAFPSPVADELAEELLERMTKQGGKVKFMGTEWYMTQLDLRYSSGAHTVYDNREPFER
jgi:hypothetical protein